MTGVLLVLMASRRVRRVATWIALTGAVSSFSSACGGPANACDGWKGPVTRRVECWRPRRIGPVIAMTLLSAYGPRGSDSSSAGCPPVVAYDQAVRERAAAEIEALPQESSGEGMMADYHVLRQQARACR